MTKKTMDSRSKEEKFKDGEDTTIISFKVLLGIYFLCLVVIAIILVRMYFAI